MKKRILFLLSCCLTTITLLTGARALPTLSCQSACVVEVDTGRVLYAHRANIQLPMASTTKIMTALLVIEAGDLDRVVTVSKQAVGVEGSSLYLKNGEQFTRKSLLYALMLVSGNDVAVALAIDTAGSVDDFVALMNGRASKIGAMNTHFANPHGLPADDHYTTAKDLTLIAAVAMRNPTFCEIVQTKTVVIDPQTEGTRRTLQNKNKLLWQFDGATGIKTGYTKAAGRCLAGAAERDGKRVVAVVLNAPDMWDDIAALMDESLDNLRYITLKKAGELMGTVCVEDGLADNVEGVLGGDIAACITNEEMERIAYVIALSDLINAPVIQGDVIGQVAIYLDDILLCETNILAANGVARATYRHYLNHLVELWIGASP